MAPKLVKSYKSLFPLTLRQIHYSSTYTFPCSKSNFIYWNPSNNECVIKYQPSTKTNSKILNGNEIITGGSIIIPIDIKTLATAISIIKKGIKIIKPI